METRSIQKTGGASFIVTLPKDWVIRQGLGSKGIVEFYETSAGQLIIRSQHKTKAYSASLTIDYLSENHIIRELIGFYVSGVHEIVVLARSITYEQRMLVRSTCYKLIGFELFEETSERMLLKNVASSTITATEYTVKMIDMVAFRT